MGLILSNLSTVCIRQSFYTASLVPTWRNMTRSFLGGSKENPLITPSVRGVGKINRGVQTEFIYILLHETNTLSWGKKDEWVAQGKKVREISVEKKKRPLEGKGKLGWRAIYLRGFKGALKQAGEFQMLRGIFWEEESLLKKKGKDTVALNQWEE